jgi:hypothetical protein
MQTKNNKVKVSNQISSFSAPNPTIPQSANANAKPQMRENLKYQKRRMDDDVPFADERAKVLGYIYGMGSGV